MGVDKAVGSQRSQGLIHVAGIVSKDNLQLFENGKLVGSVVRSVPIPVSDLPLFMGGNPTGSSLRRRQEVSFSGSLDEVRLWSQDRSLQIHLGMTQRMNSSLSSLAGYWRLDEGHGHFVEDSSGRNQRGTLGGGDPTLAPQWFDSFTPLSPGNLISSSLRPVLLKVEGDSIEGSWEVPTVMNVTVTDFTDNLTLFLGSNEIPFTFLPPSTLSFEVPSFVTLFPPNGTSLRKPFLGISLVDLSEWNIPPPFLGFPYVEYPLVCPANFFLPSSDALECQPCPEGTHTPTIGTVGNCIPSDNVESNDSFLTTPFPYLIIAAFVVLLGICAMIILLVRRRRKPTNEFEMQKILTPPNFSEFEFPDNHQMYQILKSHRDVLQSLEQVLYLLSSDFRLSGIPNFDY